LAHHAVQVNHLPAELSAHSDVAVFLTRYQDGVVAPLAEARAVIGELAHIPVLPSRSQIQAVVGVWQAVPLGHEHLKLSKLIIIVSLYLNCSHIVIVRNRESDDPLLVGQEVELVTLTWLKEKFSCQLNLQFVLTRSVAVDSYCEELDIDEFF
jgi:hypothetical protein